MKQTVGSEHVCQPITLQTGVLCRFGFELGGGASLFVCLCLITEIVQRAGVVDIVYCMWSLLCVFAWIMCFLCCFD